MLGHFRPTLSTIYKTNVIFHVDYVKHPYPIFFKNWSEANTKIEFILEVASDGFAFSGIVHVKVVVIELHKYQ